MKILCIRTGPETNDMLEALCALGYQTELYERDQEFSVVNLEEINLLAEYLRRNAFTHILSTHLIYNAAVAATIADVRYATVIWDAPYDKLFTPYGRAENCWISTFDKVDADRFRQAGFSHILYQPLSINPSTIKKWMNSGNLSGDYFNEVSFVGSLYDANFYDKELAHMPSALRDYFDSIFEEVAFRWDGEDHLYGKTGQEILRLLQMAVPEFNLDNTSEVADERWFEDFYLIRKLANIERIEVLNMLAEYFSVTCSTYNSPDVKKLQGVRVTPPIEEGEAFAIMAARSKINLNISLKGIQGGTPKRVIDIMSAGGFALTNYCKETAELFEEGREIEMFRSPEELVEKVAYYLEHEKERKAIAIAGQRKVLQDFTYEKKLKELMDWAK